MSADNLNLAEPAEKCCASCGEGMAEADDIELKQCDGCNLVRYCSDACQQNHWPEHEATCKKRAAKLRDEILFRQPECIHLGDCPICCLPIPLDGTKSITYTCCCKTVCTGCVYSNKVHQWKETMHRTCPFCRRPSAKNEEEIKKNLMKRVQANDPVALGEHGKELYYKGDYDGAFKCLTKAAESGDVEAHFNVSVLYQEGHGVEKDEKKGMYHLEEAAIAGHPAARLHLASYEGRKGRSDSAVKHLIIAANLGDFDAIRRLKGATEMEKSVKMTLPRLFMRTRLP